MAALFGGASVLSEVFIVSVYLLMPHIILTFLYRSSRLTRYMLRYTPKHQCITAMFYCTYLILVAPD